MRKISLLFENLDALMMHLRAWYKLTHRDINKKFVSLENSVPAGRTTWQDPVPEVTFNN
jgi:catalase (peroxidase I)